MSSLNWVQLDRALPKDPDANPMQIIIDPSFTLTALESLVEPAHEAFVLARVGNEDVRHNIPCRFREAHHRLRTRSRRDHTKIGPSITRLGDMGQRLSVLVSNLCLPCVVFRR
jgi:hypothetical protein